ncbi:N-acetyltransferase [Ahniella affigens]|uniref:N-acetyltransferase n=1 Tax=Ahniella affigens TaxID=2021234 RepID=A0A2P1PX39_9GAMM|nr:GNAT family N-acetyltransferase [Ahniella affigens]AVP99406.1 N-acetyltransferase [Ahniella affigens]
MQLLAIRPNQVLDPTLLTAPELDSVLTATLAMYEQRGYREPWIGYLAVRSGQIIGTCGFAGQPKDHEAEIAYFCFPAFQGLGLATEMARLLIETHRQAAAAASCRVIAHTLPEVSASTRILAKLGFSCLGAITHPEDGTVWKWALLES